MRTFDLTGADRQIVGQGVIIVQVVPPTAQIAMASAHRRLIENPRPGGIGIVFAPQPRLEPLLDQLAPGPLDSGDAGVQRRGNPAVAPAFAELRYVRLQQDTGLRQQLGGTLALADQLVELGAFLRAQPHYVLVDGNLFPDHESPPSLPCSDRESEVADIFNDGSD